MKNYEKPIVLTTEELAEGIYAASGVDANTCWTIIDVRSTQDDNGNGEHVFEVEIEHTTEVQHISMESTTVLTFNNNVTAARTEGNCTASYSGNTVTIVRALLADAYGSGDRATYKVWVKAADLATTKALAVTGRKITDTGITVNVQGNGANGE